VDIFNKFGGFHEGGLLGTVEVLKHVCVHTSERGAIGGTR
jgi:hypothetical protein